MARFVRSLVSILALLAVTVKGQDDAAVTGASVTDASIAAGSSGDAGTGSSVDVGSSVDASGQSATTTQEDCQAFVDDNFVASTVESTTDQCTSGNYGLQQVACFPLIDYKVTGRCCSGSSQRPIYLQNCQEVQAVTKYYCVRAYGYTLGDTCANLQSCDSAFKNSDSACPAIVEVMNETVGIKVQGCYHVQAATVQRCFSVSRVFPSGACCNGGGTEQGDGGCAMYQTLNQRICVNVLQNRIKACTGFPCPLLTVDEWDSAGNLVLH